MKKIDFLATDGVILNGLLYESTEKTQDIILAVHGMTSNCFKKRDEIIANKVNEAGIDYFCFNNRGSELVKYIKKNIDGKKEEKLGGTSYEDVLEGYEDILGAILKLKELGYKNIYLQGHSLGCTKIVYTYNELKDEESYDILENIKGIILLSLVDVPSVLKYYLGEKYTEYLELAEEKEREGKLLELMPKEAFIHPISIKTFLRYVRDNKEINFAQYGKDTELKKLNNISVPLFMRWGNDNEMILQDADELVAIVNNIITNQNKNIDYIDGANHNYTGKEEIIAEQIIEFIKRV
jgi:pimeloyl-ACP methyl ester carboxylesterase